MRRALLSLALIAAPCMGLAQDEPLTEAERSDRGFIVAFLEDSLSGAGRQVTLRGFAGALSSRATATQLTIADDAGVWLTLNDLTLDWTRSALLTGRVVISELTAAEIIVARAPIAEDAVPSPEASGFSLPDLPVSVDISRLRADRVVLGETLLGQPVTGRVEAALSLADGDGTVGLRVTRTDSGPDGRVDLAAAYVSATRALTVSLQVEEQAGGIAATLLDLPGAPSVSLDIAGEGPLDGFSSTVALASDGVDRLAGTISLTGAETGSTRFDVDLSGDLAPLFLPDYAAFLGDDVGLRLAGQRGSLGRIDLSTLDLRTRSLALRGQATIAADGLPEALALSGTLRSPDDVPVLIPGFDTGVSMRAARLDIGYNSATDDAWRAVLDADGVVTPDGNYDSLALRGSGRIARTSAGRSVGGTLSVSASGITLQDPRLAMAIGDSVTASSRLFWQEGSGLTRIGALELRAGPISLTASGEIAGLSEGLRTRGRFELEARDLAPLSGLAGRALSGQGTVTVSGQGSPLGGDFDVQARVDGQSLTLDQPEADRLLRGPSSIALDMVRDTTGTRLRSVAVRASALAVDGSGSVTSDQADLALTLRMDDLSRLGPSYGGALSGSLGLAGPLTRGQARITADLAGAALRLGRPEVDRLLEGASQLSLVADLDGAQLRVDRFAITTPGASANASGLLAASGSDITAQMALQDLSRLGGGFGGGLAARASLRGTPDAVSLTVSGEGRSLRIGQPEADRLLAGTSQLEAALRLENRMLRVDDLRLANPQVTVEAKGRATSARRDIDLTARLANLGLILPEYPGPVTLSGTAMEAGADYTLALTGTGPGGIDARVAGRVAPDFARADLTIRGSAQAGLANPFLGSRAVSGPVSVDLRLNGPLALSSLSGRVGLSGGVLADPGLPFSLQGLEATATLANGSAQLAVSGAVSTGGRVVLTGPISLTAPFRGDLGLTLTALVLRDPQLYQARVNGQLRINGPLMGGALISGRIALPQTEVRIAATGLGGQALIDGLRHVGDSAPVRETRRRAGLMGEATADGPSALTRPFALDLEISAPNQLFIRGRGVDAELGGTLRLTGTTDDMVPIGAFDLIRGRLDILGRRLTLSTASMQLEGDFDARLNIMASSVNDDVTSSVRIEGLVSDPQVSFTSTPQLPQEEVLSQLLFGQRLESLSAFQALQLANAVATLAGRGGEGLVSRLRRSFGLDDLDVQTNAEGDTQLTVGKYLSENVYSEFVVDQDGKSQINLNFDLTDKVTVKARVGAEGDSGVGVFYERDY